MDFKILKNLLLLLFSFFCLSRAIPVTDYSDPDHPDFRTSKFSHFGLLSSSGQSLKSKNNIFGNKFSPKPVNSTNFINLLLILSGNVEINPGPKFPCGICSKQCTSKQQSVACDECDIWFHRKCMLMNVQVFNGLHNVSWYCDSCGLPNFSS